MITIRRAVAATSAALVTAGLMLPTGPAHAVAAGPTPVHLGGSWLAGELTGGLMVRTVDYGNGPQDFTDYGLSIDAALALDAVGDDAAVQAVSDAVATDVMQYASDDTGSWYSGATAKAVVLAQIAGADPHAYGGQDLLTKLEEMVVAGAPSAGRIKNLNTFDDSNAFGQSFAARALADAGSPSAAAATDYLLKLQCADGSFQLFLPAAGAAPACDPSGSPSVDATALSVINLDSQSDDAAVQAAVERAVAWLEANQNADGSYASDEFITTPNANSTGLAGWALGLQGRTAPAVKAAAWLLAHQVAEPSPCLTPLAGERGALAYDDAALAAASADGVTDLSRDQFRRATAQALPALHWAEPTASAGAAPSTTATGYVKAGSAQPITVTGLTPNQTVCFSRGTIGTGGTLGQADANGALTVRLTLPSGSQARTYQAWVNGTTLGAVTFSVLDPKTFKLERKKTVKKGQRQVLTVKGLAAKEKVKLVYLGTTLTKTANAERRATFRFPVGGKLGEHKARVVGQFGTRKGATTFRVVK